MTNKMTLAEALREEMLAGCRSAWAGNPQPLLDAYENASSKRGVHNNHPENRVRAVLNAARRSKLFKQDGYIRACDRTGNREVLHPVFVLREEPKP